MTEQKQIHVISKRAKAGLRGSVGKWSKINKLAEELVAREERGEINFDKVEHELWLSESGTVDCPLCQLYNRDDRKDQDTACHACPVMKEVGIDGCRRTPYQLWHSASTPENAKAMLDFLVDLDKRCVVREQ